MDLAKRTILLIDDDRALQTVFGIALDRAGYNVVARDDADSGLRWLEQILPDLIILDMMLPGISGFEMLKLIRSTENGRDVPIIVATALNEVVLEQFDGYHVIYVFHKPIEPIEIIEAVNSIFT